MNLMTAKTVAVCSFLSGTMLLCAQQAPPAPPGAPPVPPSTAAPAATAAAVPINISAIGPKIQFETPVYDFGKVKSGEMVKHTFYFTNTGDDLLVITNVQPSCGCTTAGEWSRQVEPGKFGSIPIQFNSANYGGSVLKTVTVTSNDKGQPSFGLQVKGTVWKPIEINPAFAVMNIPPDAQSNVVSKVHIVNNMEEDITLTPPESNNKAFTATLSTNKPGKDFEVTISANPPFDQPNMQAQISLKTSSTNVPVVSVTAWANIQQAVVVQPPQILLGAGPLANKQPVTVMIQNNSSKPLKVSDPAVDSKGVEVQLAEPNPGRSFTATLNFPQGFDLPAGTKGEFTVKTDNPKHPLLKVPISQMRRRL